MIIGIVLTGIEDPADPSFLFFCAIMAITVIGAPLHFDFYALLCGVLYVLFIPSCFIFLPLYSIANVNDCSWGTRQEKQNDEKKKSFCRRICGTFIDENDTQELEGLNCTCLMCLDGKYELRIKDEASANQQAATITGEPFHAEARWSGITTDASVLMSAVDENRTARMGESYNYCFDLNTVS